MRERIDNTRPHMYIIFVLLAVFLLAPHVAHAYLDPGTGSMVIQMIVGSAIAGLYTIKVYWRKILGFFGKDKNLP